MSVPYIYHIAIVIAVLGASYWLFFDEGEETEADRVLAQAEKLALDNLGKIVSYSDAGDVIEIAKGGSTIIQEAVYVDGITGEEITEEEFIQKANSTGTLTDADVLQMKIEGGASYGHTVKYKNYELKENYYQISNPVLFNGIIKKVEDGSCELNKNTNEVECDYIDPPLFTYQFTVTCNHRDFCPLSDIVRVNQKTNNDGSWEQKIQTNPSDFTEGEYKMIIEANSEVLNPVTQRPYLITGEKLFYMVE